MLNNPQCFDMNETTKDQIFDKIIEGVPANNDNYFTEHSEGSPFLQ